MRLRRTVRPAVAAPRPASSPPPPLWRCDLETIEMGQVEYIQHAAGPGPMMPHQLYPNGYLRAVLVELVDHEEMPGGAAKADVLAVLHEGDPHEALAPLAIGRPPQYPAWRGERFVVWLPEPVPNMNTTRPYTLTLETDMAITVKLTQLYHRQVFR